MIIINVSLIFYKLICEKDEEKRRESSRGLPHHSFLIFPIEQRRLEIDKFGVRLLRFLTWGSLCIELRELIMAILETGIVYAGKILVNKKFYTEDSNIKGDLIGNLVNQALDMAGQAFDDELTKFSLGDYSIQLQSHNLGESAKNNQNFEKLIIFCITEKKINQKYLITAMDTALDQFLLRYSRFDIRNQNISLFTEFSDRLGTIFRDLALKVEDRFKGIF